MIKLNGVEIKIDKYPDGTFLFKNIPIVNANKYIISARYIPSLYVLHNSVE